MRALFVVLTIGFFAAGLAGACGGYKHDPNTVFPQGWKASYVKVSDCEKSGDHNPGFVEVYVSPETEAAFKAGGPYPEGSVFLKPQYHDDKCTDFALWTAMKKGPKGSDPAAEDWRWQTVYGGGELKQDGPSKFCTDCHSNCDQLVCTES